MVHAGALLACVSDAQDWWRGGDPVEWVGVGGWGNLGGKKACVVGKEEG